jgi:hypothetical protein
MSTLGALSRPVGLGTVRCLCSRLGTAFVLAWALTLAGIASFYLDQHSSQVSPRTPAARAEQPMSCGPQGSGYIPEPYRIYCRPNYR